MSEAIFTPKRGRKFQAQQSISDVRDRFFSKVEKRANGCWEWVGAKSDGYGLFWWNRRQWLAHRVAWLMAGNELPEWPNQMDHLCRNPACVNPTHLESVTCSTNNLRASGKNKKKTHCHRGHPFDEENTLHTNYGGHAWRQCRACRRERSRKRAKERGGWTR